VLEQLAVAAGLPLVVPLLAAPRPGLACASLRPPLLASAGLPAVAAVRVCLPRLSPELQLRPQPSPLLLPFGAVLPPRLLQPPKSHADGPVRHVDRNVINLKSV